MKTTPNARCPTGVTFPEGKSVIALITLQTFCITRFFANCENWLAAGETKILYSGVKFFACVSGVSPKYRRCTVGLTQAALVSLDKEAGQGKGVEALWV